MDGHPLPLSTHLDVRSRRAGRGPRPSPADDVHFIDRILVNPNLDKPEYKPICLIDHYDTFDDLRHHEKRQLLVTYNFDDSDFYGYIDGGHDERYSCTYPSSGVCEPRWPLWTRSRAYHWIGSCRRSGALSAYSVGRCCVVGQETASEGTKTTVIRF